MTGTSDGKKVTVCREGVMENTCRRENEWYRMTDATCKTFRRSLQF